MQNYQKPFLGIVILLFFLLVILPSSDMWDGIILSNAYAKGDYPLVKRWMYESSWNLFYWITRAIHSLSDWTGLSYRSMSALASFCSILFLTALVRRVAVELDLVAKRDRFMVSVIFLTLPVWHTFLSSVMNTYIHYLALGVWAVLTLRKTESSYLRIFCYLLVFLCFEFNSLIFFLPALSYAFDIKSKSLWLSLKTCFVLALGASYTVWRLVLNHPYGLYSSYNEVDSGYVSVLLTLVGSFIKFLQYFSVISLISICLAALAWPKLKNTDAKEIASKVLICAGLIFAGILPYALAGKYPYPGNFFSFNDRHALVSTIGFTLCFATFWSLARQQKRFGLLARGLTGTCLVANCLCLSYCRRTKSDGVSSFRGSSRSSI